MLGPWKWVFFFWGGGNMVLIKKQKQISTKNSWWHYTLHTFLSEIEIRVASHAAELFTFRSLEFTPLWLTSFLKFLVKQLKFPPISPQNALAHQSSRCAKLIDWHSLYLTVPTVKPSSCQGMNQQKHEMNNEQKSWFILWDSPRMAVMNVMNNK